MFLRRWQSTAFRFNRLSSVALLSLCLITLAACSGDQTPPRDLLLGPEDFPDQEVSATSRETAEISLDEPAVQVELTTANFTLLESLVLFESEDLALNIIESIKGDQILQGITAQPVDGFDDNTGVLDDQLNGDDASTLFFVQGRALVRITLTGEGRAENLWKIAALAREKSRKQ